MFSWLNSAHGDVNDLNLNQSSETCFPFMDDHTYCKSDFSCQRMYKYLMLMNWTIQNWSHILYKWAFRGFFLYAPCTRQYRSTDKPKVTYARMDVSGCKCFMESIYMALLLGQVSTGFLHQAVPVSSATWSPVTMGFHINSLQYAGNTVLVMSPTGQVCCRDMCLKKWNFSLICTDTSCNPSLSAFLDVSRVFVCLGTSGEVQWLLYCVLND